MPDNGAYRLKRQAVTSLKIKLQCSSIRKNTNPNLKQNKEKCKITKRSNQPFTGIFSWRKWSLSPLKSQSTLPSLFAVVFNATTINWKPQKNEGRIKETEKHWVQKFCKFQPVKMQSRHILIIRVTYTRVCGILGIRAGNRVTWESWVPEFTKAI